MTQGRQFLLDTNIVSAIIKQPSGALANYVASLPRSVICTSVIVASELRYGVQRKGSSKLAAQVEAVLEGIDILALEDDASHFYAIVRNDLEQRGLPIGQNDLLIAAHALALDLHLVSDNMGESSRVKGLKLLNWLQDLPI